MHEFVRDVDAAAAREDAHRQNEARRLEPGALSGSDGVENGDKKRDLDGQPQPQPSVVEKARTIVRVLGPKPEHAVKNRSQHKDPDHGVRRSRVLP